MRWSLLPRRWPTGRDAFENFRLSFRRQILARPLPDDTAAPRDYVTTVRNSLRYGTCTLTLPWLATERPTGQANCTKRAGALRGAGAGEAAQRDTPASLAQIIAVEAIGQIHEGNTGFRIRPCALTAET